MAEPARAPVPPVEEVGPGIWSLPLPVPGPLVYVLVYALATDDGVLLVDAGWDSDAALEALEEGLAAAGSRLDDVRGVLLTHAHADHAGLVHRVRRRSGAWTAMHADDAAAAARFREGTAGSDALEEWFAQLGVAPADASELAKTLRGMAAIATVEPPDRLIAAGDRFETAHGALVAMHTPGHSPGHVCFVHESADVVFTGDHVLSLTTPNVSVYPHSPPNPLGDYLGSLRGVLPLGGAVALPGHEERVPVGPRAAQILAHHDAQLENVESFVGSDERTVLEVAEQMDWAFPWQTFRPIDRSMALGEALAHITLLERQGRLERTGSAPFRWRTAA